MGAFREVPYTRELVKICAVASLFDVPAEALGYGIEWDEGKVESREQRRWS